jgi:hypothetical protein
MVGLNGSGNVWKEALPYLKGYFNISPTVKGKSKAVPLQAWGGPMGSRKVPRFLDNGTEWW